MCCAEESRKGRKEEVEGGFSPEVLKVSVVGDWNHNVVTQWVLEAKSPNKKADRRGVERVPAVPCSRKRIPSMSWERGRPFAAVARRRAHTAVNQPPLAERWHNISKSADNSWLTSKLSVEKKNPMPGTWDLCLIAKMHINLFIERCARSWKQTEQGRHFVGLLLCCWLL